VNPERFLDEIDAASAARAWIEPIAQAAAGPSRRIETPRINADGGAYLFWHNEKLAAAAWLVRDQSNFTILVKWQATPADAASRDEQNHDARL
jgi:hypothetical protein